MIDLDYPWVKLVVHHEIHPDDGEAGRPQGRRGRGGSLSFRRRRRREASGGRVGGVVLST